MANINNYYPHSLKTDEIAEDNSRTNKNLYNLQNINEKDQYACVFENTGVEYPEIAMGVQYDYAVTKAERKDLCETKNDPSLGQEKLIYIKRDDWLNPDEVKYECGVFNMDGTRKKYSLPQGNPANMKFVSKKLCNRYNDKNQGYDFYTKMVPAKLETPVKDLRSTEVSDVAKNQSRYLIFWITYAFITVTVIYWIIRYQINRPYQFHDRINSVLLNKILFLIIIFGLYTYFFCPFNMCFHDSDAPSFMLNLNKSVKEGMCKYCSNNNGYIENNIFSTYDRTLLLTPLDKLFNFFFRVNRKLETPLKFINNKMCDICNVSHKCYERKPYNTMNIVKPLILVVSSLNLQQDSDISVRNQALRQNYEMAINYKYRYKYVNTIGNKNYYIPYDTGTMIYLRTNDEYDKSLYMCCLKFILGGNNQQNINVIDDKDYVCRWVLVKDRNGPTIYTHDLKKLRIKMCPYSYRIYSVDSNYELLDYNMSLDADTFTYLFENNILNYKEYPFFPNFNKSDLRGSVSYNGKPDFIKRKLMYIYKYLIQNPTKKFRTKNVTIYNGNLCRYDLKLSSRENLYQYSIKDHFNNYIKYNNDLSNLKYMLNEINDFYNDDEDDEVYLMYYNPKHETIKKDLYLVANYKLDYEELYDKINLFEKDTTYKDLLYKLNLEFTNLNFIQRDKVRNKVIEKLIETFHKNMKDNQKSITFIKKNKNKILYESKININISSDKILSCNEIFIVEELVNSHVFSGKDLNEKGMIQKCEFCKQKCLIE